MNTNNNIIIIAILELPVFCLLVMLLIWIMPSDKVKIAENFLSKVLPKMAIAAIIKTFMNKINK